jgi:hypothetical protein
VVPSFGPISSDNGNPEGWRRAGRKGTRYPPFRRPGVGPDWAQRGRASGQRSAVSSNTESRADLWSIGNRFDLRRWCQDQLVARAPIGVRCGSASSSRWRSCWFCAVSQSLSKASHRARAGAFPQPGQSGLVRSARISLRRTCTCPALTRTS